MSSCPLLPERIDLSAYRLRQDKISSDQQRSFRADAPQQKSLCKKGRTAAALL